MNMHDCYPSSFLHIIQVVYAQDKGLGGVMVWDISQDDFLDKCGNGINPLLNTIATLIGLPPRLRDQTMTTKTPRKTIPFSPNIGVDSVTMNTWVLCLGVICSWVALWI